MNQKRQQDVLSLTAEIEKRLASLEDTISFLVKSNQRFKKGQRVKFSEKAKRSGITRTKGGVQKGRVVKVGDGFTMEVLLDGYKKPHQYHHAFFEGVSK